MSNSSAPVNSLVPEVLAQVFTALLELNSLTTSDDPFQTKPFFSGYLRLKKANLKSAVTLAEVCRYWRHVAINTCVLWTYIPITLAPYILPPHLAEVPMWLDRALCTPLDVHIYVHGYKHHELRSAIQISDINKSFDSKRVHLLYLSVGAPSQSRVLLESCFSHIHPGALTALNITIGRRSSLQSSPNLLPQSQTLQRLRLAGNLSSYACCELPNLLDLQLYSQAEALPMSRLAEWLRASPGLRRLEVDGSRMVNYEQAEFPPVTLEHLQAVLLKNLTYGGLEVVLSLLSSKASSLSLFVSTSAYTVYEPEVSTLHSIQAFSLRSTITALHLQLPQVRAPWISAVLRSLPQLRALSFYGLVINEATFNAIVEGTRSPIDFPDTSHPTSASSILRTLYLEKCSVSGEKYFRLLGALGSARVIIL